MLVCLAQSKTIGEFAHKPHSKMVSDLLVQGDLHIRECQLALLITTVPYYYIALVCSWGNIKALIELTFRAGQTVLHKQLPTQAQNPPNH